MISCHTNRGFTLIELIAVIVIIGILATVAVKKFAPAAETLKVEETRQEMDRLAAAIIGHSDRHNNGTRSDFGYVGDVGALPPDLTALRHNPGYATWHGPYIGNDLEQTPNDYKRDAWQSDYIYTGGVTITSTGSGNSLDRRLAGSPEEILYNSVSGNIFDVDGSPPGNDYTDSIAVHLLIPDGAGGMLIKAASIDPGGYFNFDSIPIGNHAIELIYIPDNDTLHRFVSVHLNSEVYSEYYLGGDVWTAGGGGGGGTGIEWIAESDTLSSGNCFKLVFWVTNNSGGPITVTSMTLTWGSPTAYYKDIIWNGATVRSGNPALGSGDPGTFAGARIINDGESVRIQAEQFHRNPGSSGPPVNMSGTSFTVGFSDGSSITFTADLCI